MGGKERNIQHHVEKAFLCPVLSPVHVHHIGKRLEGVKGNTDRKSYGFDRKLRCTPRKLIPDFHKKVKVFKIAQEQKVCRHTECQQQRFLLFLFNQQSKAEINQYRKQHQKDIFRFPPGIKKQAEYHQHKILKLQAMFSFAPGQGKIINN